jgi:hypothetical protein
MTVRELIKTLEEFDQDVEVTMEVLNTVRPVGNVLEGASDVKGRDGTRYVDSLVTLFPERR